MDTAKYAFYLFPIVGFMSILLGACPLNYALIILLLIALPLYVIFIGLLIIDDPDSRDD